MSHVKRPQAVCTSSQTPGPGQEVWDADDRYHKLRTGTEILLDRNRMWQQREKIRAGAAPLRGV